MASIIKHGFLFVLVGLGLMIGLALVARAEGHEALSVARQASPARSAQASAASALPDQAASLSALRTPHSALPLRVPFIQNQGQIADPRLLFYARTFGGTVYVTAEGQIIYVLPQSAIRNPQSAILQIRETLVDADLTAMPMGTERSGAVINSFIGNDPRRWQANIPSFNGVQFGDVYEGISLEVRATGNNVEKIFTIAPGADPARIALRLAGVEGLSITPSGELEARTVLGPVRFTAPVAYQMGGDGARQGVSVAYALEGDSVGFCVGAFDAARPLVIDPLLASTFIGGTSNNVIRAMALDNQTNVLVAGYTASTDFPVTTNSYHTNYYGGSYDGFIAKFDPYLTNLLAATYLGGSSNDTITAMAVNTNNGAVYVAGYTASRDFPRQAALYNAYRGGAYDAFVSVLNSNLASLTASTYLGGTNVDMAYGLALGAGPTQDVFVAGLTASTNFPIANTFGAASFQTNLSRAAGGVITNDAFIVRFNTNLSANLASTYLGGTNDDGACGIALDTNGFIYVAGYTASTNFPMINGAVPTYRGGVGDAFVARLSVALTNLDASTFLGGTNNEAANGIAVAPFTNIVCVVGYTYSTNFTQNPTNNEIAPGYTNQYMGGKDAFLTRLDLALTNILASTYLGGTSDDEATAVLAYATNNTSLRIYVAGWTDSSDFPVTTNAYDTTANGGRDAFVSYFGTGDTLNASTYLGGATNDSAYAMALQADHFSLFVAGVTASTNFPATLRAYDNDRAGQANDDGFVTKLGSGLAYGTVKWQASFDVDVWAWAGSPSLGWDGAVYCGYGSNLYAFDAQGRRRWKVLCAGLLVDNQSGATFGMGSIPAVSTNGTIYVTTDAPGSLQAINSTNGSIKWTFSADNIAEFSSPAIGSDGIVYFGDNAGNFFAVRDDETEGVGLWTNDLGFAIYSSPGIATNGNIFVANARVPGSLYSLAPDGSTNAVWELCGSTYSSPTFGSNGIVYIGSGSNLYAFEPDSPATQHVWAASGQIYAAPAIGSNGMIYIGGESNLCEFNPDGTTGKVWVTDGLIKSSATIDSDGSIIVGSHNTGLYSFNPDGTTNWVLVLDAINKVYYNSPLIQRDGTIYMTDDDNLYAIFGPAPTVRTTNWPTARHDVLRTGNAAFDAAALLAPTGLVAQGTYSNTVLVSWSAVANAEYYELFRGTNTDVSDSLLVRTDLLTTSYMDTNMTAGLINYYWVRVATPVTMSDFSASAAGGTPPDPPTQVAATKGNPTNSIIVTWTNSANTDVYHVYSSTDNDTNTAGWAGATNGLAFQHTNITLGRTYFYWVKASNYVTGASGLSLGDGVTNSGGTPPRAPTNITASTTCFWAEVAWSASDYADSYALYRSTNGSVLNSINIAITNELSCRDTNTTSFRYYYYWVRATNQYGMGAFSTTSAVGYRLLAPPAAVYATKGIYPNMIRASWQVEPEAEFYGVYRSVTNDPAMATLITLTTTNYADDLDITRGAGYYYWVQSRNYFGTSVLSVAYDLGGTVPRPPLGVNASDGGASVQIAVTWNAVDYAAAYEVFRQVSPVPPPTPQEIAYVTNYTDTQVLPGSRYYYWIKATNQFGPSDLSAMDSGYCTLPPPAAVTASDGLFTNHLYVAWSAVSNASGYELWRGTNSARAAAQMLVNSVTTNAHDDTSSVPGVRYYYWVKAKTAQFVSDFSPYGSGWRALGKVDIGVSDLVFLPTHMAVDGAPGAVSFRVTNYGVQNMVTPNNRVACNFYISSNSVFGDVDDKWMGGNNVSLSLAVGESDVVVLPKTVRDALAVPTVAPGWYYIFLDIQHAAPTKWLDPNLSNNTVSRNGGRIRIGATQPAGLLLVNDYNGDGYTDLAMYQESAGAWQVWFVGPQGLTQGFTKTGYGGAGFNAVPSDYDGDGKTDFAVYQEATGTWKAWLSSGNYAMVQIGGWGGPGFEPAPGDYDGDGLADPAVYQEATGTWRAWLSGAGYAVAQAPLPQPPGAGLQPVPGDYDGDGKADPAIYQEATGIWRAWLSMFKYASATMGGWGGPGYRPVMADYDLDGIMDPAVFQASTGTWKAWLSASGYAEAEAQGWGNTGMVAVPGDYDGDSLTDPAVYWNSFGMWRLWLSSIGYQPIELLAWPGEGYWPVWH